MKRIATAVALACLAGCASSPAQLQESGEKTELASNQAPQAAAGCVLRNAEAMNFGIGFKSTVSMRPGKEPGSQEVVIYGTEMHGAMGYVLVRPAGNGSTITVWRSSMGLLGVSQLDKVAQGC